MSAIGKIFRSGQRYVLTPYNGYLDFAENYLSHPNKVLPRHAPSFYDKEKMQAIGNQLHRAKKRIDSNTRTGKPSEANERPAQALEAAPEAQKAQTKPDDDVRTRKVGTTNAKKKGQLKNETGNNAQTTDTGTETPGEGQPTDGTGGSTQTPNAGTKTPDEKQAAQPGGGESSGTSAAPKSGGDYNPAEFMEKAKDQNLGRSERQMLERLGNMRANAQKVFDKGTDEQIKNELGRWGIEAKEGAPTDDYMKKIDEILKSKAESGPTIGDKFKAHHGVGLTGLGVVGVSTLDLANSRGQQSNAQLYSDPFA